MSLLLVSLLLSLGMMGGLCSAKVYKVGDEAGWTIQGNPMPNYNAWAATKSFHVGDTLLFEYNKQYHNVLEVSQVDYKACNFSSPLATFVTGNDSIVIKTQGHHYFLCGVPGHCAIGQKVEINVAGSKASPAPASPPKSPAEPKVYKVGDEAGWTTQGNPMPNYTEWASTKSFHVGDTILFKYNKQYHNVLEVNQADYKACNFASPISTFATGNDSILIKTEGHHYFLCGFPGHCAIGQKVDINVAGSKDSPAPASPPTSPAPIPAGSNSTSQGSHAPASLKGLSAYGLVAYCAMAAFSSSIWL